MLDVNVNGTFLFAKEAGHHMIKQGIKGSIIMVSSMSGVIVNRPQKQSAYNTVSCPQAELQLFLANEYPLSVKSSSGTNDEVFRQRVG
jgi:sorbose reductase